MEALLNSPFPERLEEGDGPLIPSMVLFLSSHNLYPRFGTFSFEEGHLQEPPHAAYLPGHAA